jgi:hypothetical protein
VSPPAAAPVHRPAPFAAAPGRPVRTRLMLVSALALAVALLAVRSWRIDYPYSIDFQTYWLAGARVASGEAERLYAPGGGEAAGIPLELPANEFKNLPIVAAPFAPLARLPYLESKRLFWWINLAALVGAAVLLGRFVLPGGMGPSVQRVMLSLVVLLAAAPAHTALRHGQTTPLVTLAIVGWLAAARRKPWLAGSAAALAGLVKIPALALGALDLLRDRRRAAAWAAALGLLAAVSVLAFGPALHADYLRGLTEHAGTVMTGHNNQSAAAVASRLIAPVSAYDWQPRPMPAGAAPVAGGLALAALLALAWGLAARRPPGEDPSERLGLEYPAVLAAALIALPVSWDHYFLMLLPGLATLTAGLAARGLLARPFVAGLLAFAAAGMLLPTPQALLDRAGSMGAVGGLALSHWFLGAAVVLALAVFGLRHGPVDGRQEGSPGAAPGSGIVEA